MTIWYVCEEEAKLSAREIPGVEEGKGDKNSSGDEIANVNFLKTISHTRRPTSKYRKRENLLRLTN